jgi:hypothetical protein
MTWLSRATITRHGFQLCSGLAPVAPAPLGSRRSTTKSDEQGHRSRRLVAALPWAPCQAGHEQAAPRNREGRQARAVVAQCPWPPLDTSREAHRATFGLCAGRCASRPGLRNDRVALWCHLGVPSRAVCVILKRNATLRVDSLTMPAQQGSSLT